MALRPLRASLVRRLLANGPCAEPFLPAGIISECAVIGASGSPQQGDWLRGSRISRKMHAVASSGINPATRNAGA